MPVIDAIGSTPLVELTRLVPSGHARVFAKLEALNPTGSLKDRMARAVVDAALADGRLPANGRLVEYTGGSTGTSLAFVCAARGVPATFVSSDAFSREKRDHMRALGAEVIEIPSENGRTTRELMERMIATAAELSEAPGHFYADQFRNPDAMGGYASLGQEIVQQTRGQVDCFVHSVGTAQSIAGITQVLRQLPKLKVIAVEPAESAVLSGGEPGAHKIEGVGPGFVPPIWSKVEVDEIVAVSTAEAMAMARRLAAEEALFVGTSSGANVVAALAAAKTLGPGGAVVTILCDSGLKYLSTELYAR